MDLREALSSIDVPTLVITGRFDPSTPPELGREIAAKIPGAHCIELPLAHMPQLEQPGTFGDIVQDFVAR